MGSNPISRLEEFARHQGLVLGRQLGAGVHGSVFSVRHQPRSGQSAVKVYERETFYRQERDVYLRLKALAVSEILGHAVPKMIAFDDALWVIRMTVVTRPFVLDFAGAYLDYPPTFSDEVMAQWRAEKQEQFEAHWPQVQAILRALEGHGIFMMDVNAGNIAFADRS